MDLFKEFIRVTSVKCPYCEAIPQECCIVKPKYLSSSHFHQLRWHSQREAEANRLVPRE